MTLKNPSRKAAALSEAEQALNSWDIVYEKRPDGSLNVPGSLDISGRNLKMLPDLSSVSVSGILYCNNNWLTSLKGAPQSVGSFHCTGNRLTSLEGAPRSVPGDFDCSDNQLTSLKGAPHSVENLVCVKNRLATLEGAPQAVRGYFDCRDNQLTSLTHAPASVGKGFWCDRNKLTSLEGAPQRFRILGSDFGWFHSWDEVPDDVQRSREMRAQMERDRIAAATVLQEPMNVRAPLKLRMR